MTAIPAELDVPRDATSFDPKVMSWLYESGREHARTGRPWRTTPPGTEPGEEVPVRGGTQLQSVATPYYTGWRSNGNMGHEYGVTLPPADKDALVEYLKTL